MEIIATATCHLHEKHGLVQNPPPVPIVVSRGAVDLASDTGKLMRCGGCRRGRSAAPPFVMTGTGGMHVGKEVRMSGGSAEHNGTYMQPCGCTFPAVAILSVEMRESEYRR